MCKIQQQISQQSELPSLTPEAAEGQSEEDHEQLVRVVERRDSERVQCEAQLPEEEYGLTRNEKIPSSLANGLDIVPVDLGRPKAKYKAQSTEPPSLPSCSISAFNNMNM